MNSDAYRIRKMELKAEKQKRDMDTLKAVITNPVVEFAGVIALTAAVSYALKKGIDSKDVPQFIKSLAYIGAGVDSAVIFTTGTGLIACQQIAPSLPYLIQGTTDIMKSLPAVAGALAPLAL